MTGVGSSCDGQAPYLLSKWTNTPHISRLLETCGTMEEKRVMDKCLLISVHESHKGLHRAWTHAAKPHFMNFLVIWPYRSNQHGVDAHS